jgi:thiamine pyrophosphokinase
MKRVVILADGEFPVHETPLSILKQSEYLVCCDGAAKKCIEYGYNPDAIVGDMDSLDDEFKSRYKSIIHQSDCQETNDLTKSVEFVTANSPSEIVILGATGKREDHTLGNISLLMEYHLKHNIPIRMYSDYGVFIPLTSTSTLNCRPNSQVSIFALTPESKLDSIGLKYPIDNVKFDSWWKGTLNESLADRFTISFNSGRIIIFIGY